MWKLEVIVASDQLRRYRRRARCTVHPDNGNGNTELIISARQTKSEVEVGQGAVRFWGESVIIFMFTPTTPSECVPGMPRVTQGTLYTTLHVPTREKSHRSSSVATKGTSKGELHVQWMEDGAVYTLMLGVLGRPPLSLHLHGEMHLSYMGVLPQLSRFSVQG